MENFILRTDTPRNSENIAPRTLPKFWSTYDKETVPYLVIMPSRQGIIYQKISAIRHFPPSKILYDVILPET